jgi:diguanylate cyclase
VIKVDGRLLRGVPDDPTAVNLLAAVFQVAAACATDIVAEGVESDSQVQFLIEHGIAHAQGFHLGPPMRAADLTPALTAGLVSGPPSRRGSRRDT